MKQYDFGEKKEENGLPVWQSPKYLQSKEKAIEMLESEQYKDILKPSDFWILMNTTKTGNKMIYSGLIISHNGCLKINDTLPEDKRFKPECFSIIEDKYNGGLLGQYIDDELIEYGEVTKTNCKNAYPYAMLLKRTFDRVVLKKSKLAYYGVYSDSEADEFKEPAEVKETNTADEEKLNELTVLWKKKREDMDFLGINYRGEPVNEWICNVIHHDNHNLCQDVPTMEKIIQVYDVLINRKKEQMKQEALS